MILKTIQKDVLRKRFPINENSCNNQIRNQYLKKTNDGIGVGASVRVFAELVRPAVVVVVDVVLRIFSFFLALVTRSQWAGGMLNELGIVNYFAFCFVLCCCFFGN